MESVSAAARGVGEAPASASADVAAPAPLPPVSPGNVAAAAAAMTAAPGGIGGVNGVGAAGSAAGGAALLLPTTLAGFGQSASFERSLMTTLLFAALLLWLLRRCTWSLGVHVFGTSKTGLVAAALTPASSGSGNASAPNSLSGSSGGASDATAAAEKRAPTGVLETLTTTVQFGRHWAAAFTQGRRPHMEDRYFAKVNLCAMPLVVPRGAGAATAGAGTAVGTANNSRPGSRAGSRSGSRPGSRPISRHPSPPRSAVGADGTMETVGGGAKAPSPAPSPPASPPTTFKHLAGATSTAAAAADAKADAVVAGEGSLTPAPAPSPPWSTASSDGTPRVTPGPVTGGLAAWVTPPTPSKRRLLAAQEPAKIALFGVFDGHGGDAASDFSAKVVPELVRNHRDLLRNPGQALYDSFLIADQMYVAADREEALYQGTTACVAMLVRVGAPTPATATTAAAAAAAAATTAAANKPTAAFAPSIITDTDAIAKTAVAAPLLDVDSNVVIERGPASAVSAVVPPSPRSSAAVAPTAATAATEADATTATAGGGDGKVPSTPVRAAGRWGGGRDSPASPLDGSPQTPTAQQLPPQPPTTKLYLANAGDTRAIIVRLDGSTVQLSFDHKPNRKDEMKRIGDAGGHVIRHSEGGRAYGPFRVYTRDSLGGLAVSRAFGDTVYRTDPHDRDWLVTPAPDMVRHSVRPADDGWLVIASDGLWDVLSTAQVGRFVVDHPDPTASLDRLAKQLVAEAFKRGSGDNITVFVTHLPSLLAAP